MSDRAVFWLLLPVVCSPWIVGIVWAWRQIPRDGAIPVSLGELLRQKLLPPR